MMIIMDDLKQRSHDKWAEWTTQEIKRYLKKHTSPVVPGRCSNHRRKKIKFLQNLLAQREKAERLILGL